MSTISIECPCAQPFLKLCMWNECNSLCYYCRFHDSAKRTRQLEIKVLFIWKIVEAWGYWNSPQKQITSTKLRTVISFLPLFEIPNIIIYQFNSITFISHFMSSLLGWFLVHCHSCFFPVQPYLIVCTFTFANSLVTSKLDGCIL